MNVSDWLTIAEIIVTAGVGILIATTIQNNFAKTRALRDFFIAELSALQSDYRLFVNDIWSAKLSACAIKDTLKNLSGRIDTLDKYMHKKFRLNNSIIKEAHVKFQQELTYAEELDEQYQNDSVQLSHATKIRLMPFHDKLVEAITERVIDINERKQI